MDLLALKKMVFPRLRSFHFEAVDLQGIAVDVFPFSFEEPSIRCNRRMGILFRQKNGQFFASPHTFGNLDKFRPSSCSKKTRRLWKNLRTEGWL